MSYRFSSDLDASNELPALHVKIGMFSFSHGFQTVAIRQYKRVLLHACIDEEYEILYMSTLKAPIALGEDVNFTDDFLSIIEKAVLFIFDKLPEIVGIKSINFIS